MVHFNKNILFSYFSLVSNGFSESSNLTGSRACNVSKHKNMIENHTQHGIEGRKEKRKNKEIKEVRRRGKRVMATGHDVEEALNCN